MTGRASDSAHAARRAARLVKPRTAAQLHAWIRAVLGFDIPRRALVAGHDAPFSYLVHTFFEPAPTDGGDGDGATRDCLVWANRGGGKTQLGAVATLLDLLFKPGIQVRILGGSLEQSSKMFRYLKQMLEDDVLADLVKGRITGRAVELVSGSRVEVLSQSERSVRGQRVHKLRCDEVELFDPEVWEAAQLVTRSGWCGDSFVRGSIEALSTMHRPFGLMQRLVRDWSEAAPPRFIPIEDDGLDESIARAPVTLPAGAKLFRWSVLDVLTRCPPARDCGACPLLADCGGRAKTARGFIEVDDAISQRARVGRETWLAEMLCDRPSRSSCVYRHFDPAVHVEAFETPGAGASGVTWMGGIDFGYRAPTVVLWAFVDGAGVLHIVDELAECEHTTEHLIELASKRPWPALDWIGADPAGHQRGDQTGLSNISLWQRAGIAVRSRRLSIEAGIMAVQRRLRRGDGSVGLRIHPRCRSLIRSLTLYHYPPDAGETALPVKDGTDHAADALRYLVINLDRPDWQLKMRRY